MGGPGSGKKFTEANDDSLPRGRTESLDEIGDKEGIEQISDTDIIKAAELEAFMNEKVTIVVHPATEDGALDVITPNVNGLNQPIIRGMEQDVKRKYVEVLARCRVTKYTQKVPDPTKPENIQMEERTVLSYPFAVIRDPNPRGRDWLKAILAQR